MNSRAKGKRGELEARDHVREAWNAPKAARTAQRWGNARADLEYVLPGVHAEVKRRRNIGACKFMGQAVTDCEEGELPVVLLREDHGEWLVLVRLADSVELSRKILQQVEG